MRGAVFLRDRHGPRCLASLPASLQRSIRGWSKLGYHRWSILDCHTEDDLFDKAIPELRSRIKVSLQTHWGALRKILRKIES
jgi:hypothetical protein